MSADKHVFAANFPVPLASHEYVVKDRTLFNNTLGSSHFTMGSKSKIWCVYPDSALPAPPLGFPVFSHENVVKYRNLFTITLRSFHDSIGSKIINRVPVMGGKELDHHALYVEVTRRDGFDKVVTDKKWREISSLFDFPPTATSASYALKNHYSTILRRYELVYFSHHYPQVRRTKRKRAVAPGPPKPNRSGYNFFFAERHDILKSEYPTRDKEFTKMIAGSWDNLSPQEKEVYQSYGLKDKERYQNEMKEYTERMGRGNTVKTPSDFES